MFGSKRLVVDRTTLSRNPAPLERKMFIRLEGDPSDGQGTRRYAEGGWLQSTRAGAIYWQEAPCRMLLGLSRGIGKEPAASAIVADVVDIAHGRGLVSKKL